MKSKLELIADGLMDVRAAEKFTGIGKSKLYSLMAHWGELPYLQDSALAGASPWRSLGGIPSPGPLGMRDEV